MGTLYINGGDADVLVNTDAFALMVGMLLDQQISIEWAFKGPFTLRQRLGHLDPALIAAEPVQPLLEKACAKPAIHRFPASMAHRIHELATLVASSYGNDASAIWTTAADGRALFTRLKALPGFGEEKAQIFQAMLAKRFNVHHDGWQSAVGAFSDDMARTVADLDSPERLLAVRAYKVAQKAAEVDKQDRPQKPHKPKIKPNRNPPPDPKAKSTKKKGRPRPNLGK